MDQHKTRRTSRERGREMPLPRARKDGVLATDVGNELVVYDSKDHRGHCLNPAAAVVWRHLDGQISMEALVASLRRELDAPANEDTVRLALEELDKAHLLAEPLEAAAPRDVSRRSALRQMAAAAGGGAVLLPAITSIVAPPAHAQVSAVGCSPPDTCQTFTCQGGCACVPTTEGSTVCIVPTCVAPCTTTADCPPGTVCFTLGCCGPATFCVPIAPTGTNCGTAAERPWQGRR
jgi:Coenzyme PQQ synthesis protein D (PqqD)